MNNSQVEAMKTSFDSLRCEGLDTALRLMLLKMTSERSVKIEWSGVYSTAEFEQDGSDDESSTRQTRVQLRKEFLRKMCGSDLAYTQVCVQMKTSQRSEDDKGKLGCQIHGQTEGEAERMSSEQHGPHNSKSTDRSERTLERSSRTTKQVNDRKAFTCQVSQQKPGINLKGKVRRRIAWG